MKRSSSTTGLFSARRIVSALFALWSVLAMLAPYAAPAVVRASLGARGALEVDASSQKQDAVTTVRARTVEASAIRRSPRAADRTRERRSRDGGFAPFRLASAYEPTAIAANASGEEPRPRSRLAWHTPARARAHLMVFLN